MFVRVYVCVWHYLYLLRSLRDFRVFSVSLKGAYYNEKYVFQNLP